MYKKIMVPLDGSELAECVLPHVETIARGCQVPDIVFIQIIEPARLPSVGEYVPGADLLKQIDTAKKASAEEYLNGLISRLELGQVSSRTEIIVEMGVAETLADYAVKSGMDLIVIATHGRSGVGRWVMGSVADRILRSSCIPVFMVRAPGCVPNI